VTLTGEPQSSHPACGGTILPPGPSGKLSPEGPIRSWRSWPERYPPEEELLAPVGQVTMPRAADSPAILKRHIPALERLKGYRIPFEGIHAFDAR
jgi:hypothetical protein